MGILLAESAGSSILMANSFLLNQFGYTSEEVTGKCVTWLIPLLRHITDTAAMEYYGIRKNGTRFPVSVSLKSDEGSVIIFVTDISDQHIAKETLRALETAIEKKEVPVTLSLPEAAAELTQNIKDLRIKNDVLRQLNKTLNNIWLNINTPLTFIRPDGLLMGINPAGEKILGYDKADLLEKQSVLIFHDPEEIALRADEFSQQLQEVVEPGINTLTIKAQKSLLNESEWVYIRKDGSRLPVSISVSPIYREGNIDSYIIIAIDITDRKKAEEEILKTLENERELNMLKSRFIALTSHEFRTPLSTILSSNYLLSKYQTTADQPKRDKHILRIARTVTMLRETLNVFLSVEKIEEKKIHVRNSTEETHKFVAVIVRELEGLRRGSQQLRYSHDGLPDAYLDHNLLKHILMNLISNAIKFSPETGIIRIHTISHPEKFILSVKDEGIGIAEEDRQHLFERFFRGSNAEAIQGTGLGLHIVAKYAELMKGDVICNSEKDKGTEFIVTIPSPQN
ncbi:ATP-binding protein [Chitinophaga sp. MM2321]|uniref:sensor histidine kinase n=1 Tax=Chitinophaga sp. MM2321 TaxID=3137178 RepID=UPI0032D59C5D